MKRTIVTGLALLMAAFMLIGCSVQPAATNTGNEAAQPTEAAQDQSSEAPTTQAPASTEPTAKIAIIFSTLGDLNFNDWCYNGIVKAQDELGIEFDYVEAATVSDAETQIEAFAGDGVYGLIVVVGSDRQEAMEMIAVMYPEQKFALIDAAVSDGLANCVGMRADYPQWQFLSGCLAGIVTKDSRFGLSNPENIVGFAGGKDSPVSRAGAAGFLSGAKYTNHDVQLLYTIVGSYTDPTLGKEIGMTTYGQGADVMSVNCGSSANGVKSAAEESGRYFCSTSPALISPTNQLCVSITRFDLFVYWAVEMVLNNTWEAGTHIYGIADGACNISFDGFDIAVPDDVKAILDDIKQKIVNGEITFVYDPDEIDTWAETNNYYGE